MADERKKEYKRKNCLSRTILEIINHYYFLLVVIDDFSLAVAVRCIHSHGEY